MGQNSSRQEAITTEVSDPKTKNWLCANMAMRETSQALARSVHRIIAHLHKDMLRTMGKYPACQRNCSRSDNAWCSLCERLSREMNDFFLSFIPISSPRAWKTNKDDFLILHLCKLVPGEPGLLLSQAGTYNIFYKLASTNTGVIIDQKFDMMITHGWSRQIIAICEPNYRSRINWSRFNSSQWPHNPYEVARVFMPRAHRLYYKSVEFHEDFRFSLSFLENCYQIPMSNVLCERAWMFRSRLKRKNNLMRMKRSELEEGISILKDLLSFQELDDNLDVLERLDVYTKFDSDESSDGCSVM